MLAESAQNVQSGNLDSDVHLPSTAKLELIAFITEELPRWRDHPDRPIKQNETTLTEHLCDHLNSATYYSANWSHIQFRTETGDESRPGRKIDLTVKPRAVAIFIENRRHSQFDSLFPIECKRLPTPKEKDRDEREYVITESATTGGIQRFKDGHHGAGHSFAAMIGYVQEHNCGHWLKQVNAWIQEMASAASPGWSDADLLEQLSHDSRMKVSTIKSRHQRAGNLSDCDICHLWIEMN